MKQNSKEIKIALVAVLSIIMIYVGIILMKGLSLFDSNKSYVVVMPNANGITVSSDVLANGVKVGYVKGMSYDSRTNDIKINISITPDFNIPSGTGVYISKEMLGNAKLNFAFSSMSTTILSPGDTIFGTPSTDLMTAAGNMIPQIESLIPKIDSILTSLNKLASDPALASTLHNIEETTENLSMATGQLYGMLAKDVPHLLIKTNSVMDNAVTLTNNLNKIDLEGIANNANSTLSNVNGITSKLNTSLNSKDNTLGLLMNDNTIALKLDTTIANASLLLEDLRLHPKRYVHFSIFGKKDK